MINNRNLKVVMLQDFFGLNLTYQENLLAESYIKLGCRVTVICSTFENVLDYIANKYDPNKKTDVFSYKNIKVIRVPYGINLLNRLRWHKNIYQILEEEKPDIIYAHDIHLNIYESVKYLRKHSNTKLIMDYHADFKNSAKNWLSLNVLHKIIRKQFLYRYKKYISRIYPVTPSCADFLHYVYKLDYDELELLPLGCDYEKCKIIINTIERDKVRQKLNIPKDAFLIISGGKFNPLKKTEMVIKAVSKVNNPNVHLLIFGSPELGHEQYAGRLIELANITNNVHLLGYLSPDKMLEMMAVSDLAIYPSSQSAVWQQSIGMHLPLILGGEMPKHVEYLNKYDNLIIIDPDNLSINNIVKHINKLISNPEILFKMKSGAKKMAEYELDYMSIAKKTLEIFNDENITNIK